MSDYEFIIVCPECKGQTTVEEGTSINTTIRGEVILICDCGYARIYKKEMW